MWSLIVQNIKWEDACLANTKQIKNVMIHSMTVFRSSECNWRNKYHVIYIKHDLVQYSCIFHYVPPKTRTWQEPKRRILRDDKIIFCQFKEAYSYRHKLSNALYENHLYEINTWEPARKILQKLGVRLHTTVCAQRKSKLLACHQSP
jgi:hypothetical protein